MPREQIADETGVPVTLKLPVGLLREVDDKAARMDLNRSQYFRRLARRDLRLPVKRSAALEATR